MKPVSSFCLLMAKGNSTRLPNKNKLELNGKPLLCYSLEAAISSKVFDEIWLSSDDQEIINIGKQYPSVLIDERPSELTTPEANGMHVLLYMIGKLKKLRKEFDLFCMLQPTSPLRTYLHLREAYEMVGNSETDFVVGIQEYDVPPRFELKYNDNMFLKPEHDGYLTKITHKQSIQTSYHPSGGFTIGSVAKFLEQEHFYGNKTRGYILDKISGWDIDDAEDFMIAEALLKVRDLQKERSN